MIKDIYMLTIVYSNGESVDTECSSKEERKFLYDCVKNVEGLRFTFWELGREVNEAEQN